VVFENPDVTLTYRNILQLAIDKEDASFKFYVTMIGQTQDAASKDVLMALAEEEVKHKLRFQTAYNNLSHHI
jgi:rubrerythrin